MFEIEHLLAISMKRSSSLMKTSSTHFSCGDKLQIGRKIVYSLVCFWKICIFCVEKFQWKLVHSYNLISSVFSILSLIFFRLTLGIRFQVFELNFLFVFRGTPRPPPPGSDFAPPLSKSILTVLPSGCTCNQNENH